MKSIVCRLGNGNQLVTTMVLHMFLQNDRIARKVSTLIFYFIYD